MERGVKIAELTRMASNHQVFRHDAALMVLTCMGSLVFSFIKKGLL
jgi:hypothetical protein